MKMHRLLPLIAAALFVASPSHAQTAKIYRIGFLSPGDFAPGTNPGRLTEEISRHLAQSGFTTGANLELIKRGAAGHFERLPALVAELAAANVDVIVTFSYPVAAAAQEGTSTVTGISDVAAELAPKRLELLKEAAPHLLRVAMLWNANDLGMTTRYEASAAAAKKLGVTVLSFGVREPDDFGGAFEAMERDKPDGLLMVADALTFLNRKRVFDFAAEHRLPVIYETSAFAHDGGLMSYGPDENEAAERGANLVLRILKGEKPADLPLEQPTRFRLVINLKTAKALGLAVPPGLLVAADEVIE